MVRLGVKDWAGFGAALAAVAAAGPAHAGVAEARFGVMAHNICATYCDNSNKEDGPAVSWHRTLCRPIP